MIRLTLNGEPIKTDVVYLSDLILQKTNHSKMYAVAVNEYFIPKNEHSNYSLSDGDVIELVTPMQGG
ncbi:sulfur carrier protein ThiS [Aliikangiella sp. IMCC44359]|uniref:sulfur carrier protein ThiS n=1 Tax=Aliikangiella sp. IMCC44359 TaxID=3459125 RepID=UPI00403B2FD1